MDNLLLLDKYDALVSLLTFDAHPHVIYNAIEHIFWYLNREYPIVGKIQLGNDYRGNSQPTIQLLSDIHNNFGPMYVGIFIMQIIIQNSTFGRIILHHNLVEARAYIRSVGNAFKS